MSSIIGGAGGRVMRGVRLLLRSELTADGMRGQGGWRGVTLEASPAVMNGLTSVVAGGGRHGAGWVSPHRGGVARGGLKMAAI